MAEWPKNPAWIEPKIINAENQYNANDGVTVSDMNTIVNDLLYLYINGGGGGGGGTGIGYTVTFISDGITFGASYVLVGQAITQPTITKEEYTFLGWFTDAEGGTIIKFPYEPTEDATFYAHWAKRQLAAPVISLSGSVVSWAAVSNATAYSIIAIADVLKMTSTTSTSFDLSTWSDLTVGTWTVQVRSTDGTVYSDSSNTVTYIIRPQLDTPVLTDLSADGVCKFSFPNDTRAYAYKVFVDGVEQGYGTKWSAELADGIYTVTMNDSCFPTVKTYTVAAQAYSKDGTYQDSHISSPILFTPMPQLATPQNVTADGTTVSWDAVENATSYDVYADDTVLLGNTTGEVTPQGYKLTLTSISLYAGQTVSIHMTNGDGTSTVASTLSNGMRWENVKSFYITDTYVATYATVYINNTQVASPSADSPYVLTQDTAFTYNNTCLTGDTLITLADGSEKRIDQLTLNDKVLSYNPKTLLLEPDEITYTDATENKSFTEYDKWTFEDGSVVKTVHRHRFYNVERKAMIYMDAWKIGEHATTINGKKTALVSHETIVEDVRHYTIFTKNQNYFANGLLSGNRHTKSLTLYK